MVRIFFMMNMKGKHNDLKYIHRLKIASVVCDPYGWEKLYH